MKSSFFIVLGVIALLASNSAARDEFTLDSITNIMHHVGEYRLKTGTHAIDNSWIEGAYFAGIMALYSRTKDPKYLDSATAWAQYHNWKIGTQYNGDRTHADNHACTQTYCEIFKLNPLPQNAFMYRDWLGTWLYVGDTLKRRGSQLWSWCDALFMAPPAVARLSSVTGTVRFLDTMDVYWWDVTKMLYDTTAHLFFRDASYFYPAKKTKNGFKVFWSRGNGWVVAGTARVLDYMASTYPSRPKYEKLLCDMCAALKTAQGSDGMWHTSLADYNEFTDPEMSGTCFFCFAMAWCVNKGLLDRPTYEPVIRKAWSAMVKNVSANGSVLRVQDVGAAPGPAPVTSPTKAYAEGAFCLAGDQMYEMLANTGAISRREGINKTQSPGKIGVIIAANGIASIELPENATGAALYDFRGRLLYKVHAFPALRTIALPVEKTKSNAFVIRFLFD